MSVKGVVALVVFVVILLANGFLGIHKVEEGHVGVYWRGGALLNGTTPPGFHLMLPFVTQVSNVRITHQTDTVTDVPCGTSGGVMIYFDKIEVVNKLNAESAHRSVKLYGINYDKTWIFDKVHHEINQFCSSHTLGEVYIEQFSTLDEALRKTLQKDCDEWETGITILSIRVTKPRIPEGVRKNYEQVEQQKTQLLVASQSQTVIIKQEETQKLKEKIQAEKEAEVAIIQAQKEANVATISAQKEADVSAIRVETSIAEKKGLQIQSNIENEMLLDKEKALADAAAHLVLEEAEANVQKLTPLYVRSVLYEQLAKTEKQFFGDSMSKIFLEWMPEDGVNALFGNTAQQQQQQIDEATVTTKAKKENETKPATTSTKKEKKEAQKQHVEAASNDIIN